MSAVKADLVSGVVPDERVGEWGGFGIKLPAGKWDVGVVRIER